MMNVLLVDDEPWVLEGLRTIVNWGKYGFSVCGEAENGKQAWPMIEQLQPDLVFTDIQMPTISGLELIDRSLHQLVKPPRFIILSGYNNFEYARAALRPRVEDYLLKPIDEDEIEAVLEQMSLKIRNEQASEELYRIDRPLYVNNLLNRLLQGEENCELEAEVVSLLNLDRKEEVGCLLVNTELEQNYVRGLVCQLAGDNQPEIFTDAEGRMGLITSGASRSNHLEELEALGCRLYEACCGEDALIVAFGHSSGGGNAVRSAYEKALSALEWKRYHMSGGLVVFSAIPPLNYMKKVNIEALDSLMGWLCDDHQESFEPLVDQLLAAPASSLPASDMEYIRIQLLALEMAVLKKLKELEGDTDYFLLSLQAGLERTLMEIDCYPAFRQYGLTLCAKGSQVLRKRLRERECNPVFQITQYVNREFRQKLQLQELAERFHMNPNYLGQVFKQQTGQSFREYLNNKRMEEAKVLLRQGRLSIAEIAIHSGYPNPDYFVSQFKRMTGIAPTAFRKQHTHHE